MNDMTGAMIDVGVVLHESLAAVLEQTAEAAKLDMAEVNFDLRQQLSKLREAEKAKEEDDMAKTFAPGLVINANYVVTQADIKGRWVVLLCPRENGIFEECRKAVVSVLPGASLVAGRTVKLPSGGRITVMSTEEEPFDISQDFEVFLSFINFAEMKSDKRSRAVMERWRDRASGFLNPSNEIRA